MMEIVNITCHLELFKIRIWLKNKDKKENGMRILWISWHDQKS